MEELPEVKPSTFGIPILPGSATELQLPPAPTLPSCRYSMCQKCNLVWNSMQRRRNWKHHTVCMRKWQHCVFVHALCHIRRSVESFGVFHDDYKLVYTLFLTSVFTDSPSPSPVPHPPVWRPRPPYQSFAPRQMFPSPSLVGYNPYRVEQRPGVYVWEYMWGVWRGLCVWCHQDGNIYAMTVECLLLPTNSTQPSMWRTPSASVVIPHMCQVSIVWLYYSICLVASIYIMTCIYYISKV